MPTPDSHSATVTSTCTDSGLLYTLSLANGRTVSVYGNPATWRQTAANMLLGARRIATNTQRIDE